MIKVVNELYAIGHAKILVLHNSEATFDSILRSTNNS